MALNTIDQDYLSLPAQPSATAVSVVKDLGSIITGFFTFYYGSTKLGTGTASIAASIWFSTNGTDDWAEVDATSAVLGTARYIKAQLDFSSSALDSMYVAQPEFHVVVQVKLKGESHNCTIGATGILEVVLNETYFHLSLVDPVVQYVPGGDNPYRCMPEIDPTLTKITLYNYDNANALAAGNVLLTVRGY